MNFKHESTSTNTSAIDHQTCWSSSSNPTEDLVSNFMMPPVDSHLAQPNSFCHEEPNLGWWGSSEPSSSNTQNDISYDEPKTELIWSPSLADSPECTPSFEEPFELTESKCFHSRDDVNPNFHLNEVANDPLLDTISSDSRTQSDDINGRLQNQNGDEFQFLEFPTRHQSFKLLNGYVPSASSSSLSVGSQAMSGRCLIDENIPELSSPFQGRRLLSCKRKSLEGTSGQSSGDVRSVFQHINSSGWHGSFVHNYDGSSSSLANLSENIHGIELSNEVLLRHRITGGVHPNTLPGISAQGDADNSLRRNVRMRLNPSHYQDSVSNNFYSSEIHSRHFDIPFSSSLLRFNTAGRVSPLPQSGQRLNVAFGSRSVNSSTPIISGTREVAQRPDSNSRRITRNSTFIPSTELRNPNLNSSYPNLSVGNVYNPGNVASTSTSRTGLLFSGISSPASNRNFNYNSISLNSQRLAGFGNQSLFRSSIDFESTGQSSNHAPIHYIPSASSLEMPPFSIPGNEGHLLSYARPFSILERQGDGVHGLPYLARNHSTSPEARSRLVSELRNVINLVRRTEGFEYEDGHWDMRLDIDTMSYEELLELEERIGNVNTGLSEEMIFDNLKQHKFLFKIMSADQEPCCICREEYSEGEDVGSVECGHEFHAACIRQWLRYKNLCPICRTTALKQ